MQFSFLRGSPQDPNSFTKANIYPKASESIIENVLTHHIFTDNCYSLGEVLRRDNKTRTKPFAELDHLSHVCIALNKRPLG